MELIARQKYHCDIVNLMNLELDKSFGWNLLYLLQNTENTIEFRRGPASTSEETVFAWVEFTVTFVQTAMQFGSIEKLEKVPPSVGGLRWFLSMASLPNVDGMYDSRHLLLRRGS